MAFAYTHGASAVRAGIASAGAGADGSKVQRFRFMTVAKRAASLDVAVGRQIKQDYELGAAPKSDYKHACFTAEALSLALDTDSSKEFASFARAIYSKVQSMPLLLHHKDEIVEQFVKALSNQRTVAWRSLLKLIAVMARDLREELYPNFKTLFVALMDMITPSMPEVTAEVFQTLAYLFKYLHDPLLSDIDTLKVIYGPVLAHPRDYIRDFGAQSLAYLLRRLEAKSMSKHACGLLRSMGDAVPVIDSDGATASTPGAATPQATLAAQLPGDRPAEMKDGVAGLLFQLCRGVQGGFHSRAEGLLSLALKACRPKLEAGDAAAASATATATSQPSDAKLARRYQVLQLTLGMLQRYAGVSSAAMVLQLLHGEISKCHKAWEAAAAAAGQALPVAAKRSRAGASSDAAAADAGAAPPAAHASYALSLSAHIGRVASSLTRWYAVVGWRYTVDAAEPQRVMGTLARLLRPAALSHELADPMARGQALLLAVNAWKVALTPKVGNKGRKTSLQRMVDSRASRGEHDDSGSDDEDEEEARDEGDSGSGDDASDEEGAGGGAAGQAGAPNTGEAIQKRLERFTALLSGVLTAPDAAGGAAPGMVHASALPHTAAHAVPGAASGTALGGHLLSVAWAAGSAATAAAASSGDAADLCSPSALLGQVCSGEDAPPATGGTALGVICALQPLQLAFVRDLLTMAVGDAEGRAGVAQLRAVPCRDPLIAAVLPGGMRVIAPAAQAALADSGAHSGAEGGLLARCAPLFSALLQMWDALHGAPEITARASPEVDAATGAARTLLEDLVPALAGVLAPSGRLLLTLEHGGDAASALVATAAAGAGGTSAGSASSGRSASKKKGRKSGGAGKDWHAAVLAEQKAKAAAGRKRRRSDAAAGGAAADGGADAAVPASGAAGGAGGGVATAMALACIEEAHAKVQAIVGGQIASPQAALATLTGVWGALSALPTLHLQAAQVLPPLAKLCAALTQACASAEWARCGLAPQEDGPPLRTPLGGVGAALHHCAAAATSALGTIALCALGAGLSAGADLLPYAPADSGLQEGAAAAATSALDSDLMRDVLGWANGVLQHGQAWSALWRLSDSPDVRDVAPGAFSPPSVPSLFSQGYAQQRALAAGLAVVSLRATHVLLKAANCAVRTNSDATSTKNKHVLALDAQGNEAAFHPALSRATFGQWVGALLPTLSGGERTLRLLALQVLCQFPGATYALPGQGAGSRKALDAAEAAEAADTEGGEGGSDDEGESSGDEEGGGADEESLAFEGHCPVPLLAFRLELLPKTMLTQRAVVIRITRLRRMLELRVLPAEEAALAAALALGLMHVRYAALWKPVSSMLRAALRVLPDLVWPLLARALLHSTANRASLDLSQAALVHACLRRGATAATNAVRSAPKAVQRLADEGDVSGDLAVASAITAAAGAAVAASAAPALSRLAVRLGLTALYGTVGADALMPSVAEHVGDLNAARAAQGAFTHGRLLMAAVAREQVRSLGAAGRSDANTMHRGLTSLLRVAPKMARLRAAVLVPLVLGSTMRDYYGAAARNDPDAAEVALPAAVRRLAALPGAGIEGKATAVTTDVATLAHVRDSSGLPNAASPAVVLSCILHGVSQQPTAAPGASAGVLADARAVDGATPLDMIAADTTRRLSNWLGVLGTWRSWGPVPEYATLWALGVRLLGKPDGGISKAALAMVLAFAPPHVTPYREALQGLVTDQTFRSELTKFSPAPGADGGIGTEHRGPMLPLLLRLLFGRVSARSGVASRAALHARRAAILAYVGGMHRRELAFLVYLTLRAFTVSMTGGAEGGGSGDKEEQIVSPNGAGGNLFGFAPRNTVDGWLQGVYAAQTAPGAAHAKWDEGAADPASETEVAQLVAQFSAVLDRTPASRAVGFLNLLPHMVKQLAHRLRGYLHLLLAPVAALYKATANCADEVWSPPAGPGRAAAPIASRAQEIRGLCLQRLAEVVRQFPGYAAMPHFFAHLAPTMAPGIAALPKHASTGDRPPYMLRLLEAVASQRGTAPLLACEVLFPGAATAALRCLTAGMGVYQPGLTGAKLDANSQALSALGLPTQADVTVASVITGRSPGVPILNAAFAVTEALLGAAYGHASDAFVDLAEALRGESGASAQRVQPTQVQPHLVQTYGVASGAALFAEHMPLLLHQLTVRIAARGRVDSLMTAIAEGDVEGVQLADVDGDDGAFVTGPAAGSKQAQARRRGMVRAFARRELTLTTRAAECMAEQAAASTGTDDSSGQLCARLFALLLPQVVPSQRDLGRLRAAASADGPSAAEVAVVGGSAAGGVGRRDPRDDILHVLDKLVFSVPASHRALHIPLLSGLLAPGPFAVAGGTRRSVLALLGKLVDSAEAAPAEGALSSLQLLRRLTAVSSGRIGGTDFDAILAAQRTAGADGTLKQLLRASGSTRAVPALLHQLLAGLHDDDVAVSTGAATAVAATISHLTGVVGGYLAAGAAGDSPTLALVLAPWFTWCSVVEDPPKGVPGEFLQACSALSLLWECVLPALRASLAAGADTVRRAVVGLLGHAASGSAAWPHSRQALVDVSALVGAKGQWQQQGAPAAETVAVAKPNKAVRALRAALASNAARLGTAPAAGATVGGSTFWEAWMTTPLSTGPALPSDCPLLHTRPVQGSVPGASERVPVLSLHSLLHADLASLLAWPADELVAAQEEGVKGGSSKRNADDDDDDDDMDTALALPGAAADSAAQAKTAARAGSKGGKGGDGDAEVATRDLLNGLAHIKVHKRARSARRVAAILRRDTARGAYDSSFSVASGGDEGGGDAPALAIATVQHVLLPLALHSLYDHSTAPGKRKGKAMAAQWHELQREAAALVAACAGALPWPSYVGLLSRLARLIGEQDTDAPLQKALLASLAGALDAMRFEVAEELPADTTVVISGSMTWDAQRRLQASKVKRETRVRGMDRLRASLGAAAAGGAEPSSDAEDSDSDDGRSHSDEEPTDSGDEDSDVALGGSGSGSAHDTQLSWAQRLRYVLTPAASTPEATPEPSEVARHLYVRVLPKLKLLLQPMPKAISAQDARVTPAGAAGTDPRRAIAAARLRRDAPTTAPLRTPIALALVKLLKRLPQSVFITELPPVLTRITGVLQSKNQATRNVTKTAVVQTAVELGAQYLPYMVTALTGTLKEGYMVHVRGHAVHAVLAGLVHAGELATPLAKEGKGGSDSDASDSDSDSEEEDGTLTTAQQALVSCLPGVLDVVMMDVMGAVALARQKDSGYRPKVALAEAKSCKSYDTYALLARCIPFLPHPAVHALLAPPLLALSTQGTVPRVRQAVDELLKGAMGGLLGNPAVQAQPEALLSLTFCLVRDNLMTSGVATAEAMKAASNAQEDVSANWAAKKAKMEAKARVGAAAATGDTQALLDAARASVALRNASAQRIRRHTLGKATAWIVGDAYSAMEAAMPAMLDAVGVGSGASASATLMSAGAISASAARLTAVFESTAESKGEEGGDTTAAAADGSSSSAAPGSSAVVDRSAAARAAVHASRRVTAFPQDTFKIAAEPRRRYRVAEPWTGEAAVQAGGGGGGTLAATKLVWMGLTLLQAALRKGVVNTGGEGPLAHLDPFVPLLAHTLSATRQTDILRLALKAVTVFMPKAARLPSVAPNATVIARSVLRHARAAAGGGRAAGAERDELAQAAVKATTSLIRHVQEVTLGTAQLSALLLLVQADLENPKRQGSTFDLLRSVLGRRFVAPELYDTMDQVSHFMVQAPKSSTRALCARTFLTYLLNYPLSPKRLTGYMHFFLSNLAYSQSHGRLAVLDMLLAIIKAFPQEVLAEHAGVVFVPLVQRLGLEPATDVRAGVGAVLQALLGALPPLESRKLLDMCVAWASASQPPAMRRVGLHGLCLAASGAPQLLAPLLDTCLARSLAELHSAVAALDASEARIQAVYDDALREATGIVSSARQAGAWWDAGEEGGEGGAASGLSSAMAALGGTGGAPQADDAALEAAASQHAAALGQDEADTSNATGAEEEDDKDDEATAVAGIAADAGGVEAAVAAASDSEGDDSGDEGSASESDSDEGDEEGDASLLEEAAAASDRRREGVKGGADALPAGAIVVPGGLGGGGGVILSDDGPLASGGASKGAKGGSTETEPERIAFAAAAAAARREGEALPWETAYYATLLQERLWSAHGAALSKAVHTVGAGAVPAEGAPTPKRARGKKNKKRGADQVAVGTSSAEALGILPSIAVFPHAWVRAASARWLQAALTQEDVTALQPVNGSDEEGASAAPPSEDAPWLQADGTLFALMRAMCVQLSDTTLSPEHGEALAPVLLFGAVGLWRTTPETRRNVLPEHLVQRVLDARGTQDHPASEEIGGADVARGQVLPAADNQSRGQDPLFWLMNRLCNIAVAKQGTAARTALNVLGAMAGHVPQGALARYAVPITRCLFRVLDAAERWAHSPAAMQAAQWSAGARQAAAAAEAGELAQTVMPVVSANMGEEVFSAVFNYHRAARTGARQARMQAAARTAVVDPVAHAAAKRIKAEGKKRNKSRRMGALKKLRGAGVKRSRE